VAQTRAEFVAARTRDCFEEVAMLGVQRTPLLGDPWRSSQILEQRMLANIDAIASFGGAALACIEPMVRDAPAKDASRGFATAMICGCFSGRDALGVAERVLHDLGPADAEIAGHFAGALKLVPHPDLPAMLRSWLADPDPALRAMAIDVLAYRGLATPAELTTAAADRSPAVAAAALPALSILRPPELGELVTTALQHDDPALREAGWAAMVLSGNPHATRVLHGELQGPLASRAALWFAISAEDDDAERLLAALKQTVTVPLLMAAGWAGLPSSIPVLIDSLRNKDPVLCLTAAYALDRITGARLYEEVDVPPEKIDVPDVDTPDVGEEDKPPPLAKVVSDPRDLPSDGAPDRMMQPSVRVARWAAYWQTQQSRYAMHARYRRGQPYTPHASLHELDAWRVTPPERRFLQRELIVRTGQFVRFDPHDFVPVQEAALRQWEPIAERASSTPGSWAKPMRR
jgi:uncharacterized protein (TIGR02270 family)